MSLYIKDELEFKKMFLSNQNIVYTFIYKNGKKILNLLSLYLCDLEYQGKMYKIAEILFYFREIDNTKEIISYLIDFAKTKSIDYLSIPGLGNNLDIINNLQTEKGKVCYLQMYNYGLKTKLLPSEICFPFA